jgi:hypothetical protein
VDVKKSLELMFKAATAGVFVLCVEHLARHFGRRRETEERVASKRTQARLRVRHQAHARRVIFSVEGTLDEFAARLLACSVAQVPASSTAVIDLTEATPIRGGALAVFARVFSAGRRVQLRGVGEDHSGLLAMPSLAA